jgi:hypothetical protein
MIRTPTVLIVGAGASREANLPLGNELKRRISGALDIRFDDTGLDLLAGDRDIMMALRHHLQRNEQRDLNRLLNVCREIAAGMPGAISIDHYLHQRGEDADRDLCAKLAIVKTIADAERASFLHVDPQNPRDEVDFDRLDRERAWYIQLGRMVTGMVRAVDLANVFNNLTVVTFNYDRCIQQFFLRWLMNQYVLPEANAAAIVRRLRVHHVYGSLGPLPWMHPNGVGITFGQNLGRDVLLEAAGQIHTFTESHEDLVLQRAIHDAIAAAHVLVYLGFAYHDISMQLIRAPGPLETRRIFATRFEVSNPNWEVCSASLINDRTYRTGGLPAIREGGIQSRCGVFLAEWERQILA